MTLFTLDCIVHLWLAVSTGLALYGVLRQRWPSLLVSGIWFVVGILPMFWLRTLDLFAAMRGLAWLLFLYLPLWLGFLAAVGIRRRGADPLQGAARIADGVVRGVSALGTLIIVAVGIDAFFIEPTWIETTTYRIESERVDEPLLIAVISDLQTDAPGAYERSVLEQALAPGPDLVLFPGDFVQHPDPETNARLRQELRELFRDVGLDATHGVVAVQGNVDYPAWTEIFEDLPVTANRESSIVRAGPMSVTALSFSQGFNANAIVGRQKGFHIAMAHGPDFALGRVDADLLVAGHTHGGQVRIPGVGPLITFSQVPKPWAAGRTELDGGRTLIVSRGVGMERAFAPRLRFFCRPELVFIEVVPTG